MKTSCVDCVKDSNKCQAAKESFEKFGKISEYCVHHRSSEIFIFVIEEKSDENKTYIRLNI